MANNLLRTRNVGSPHASTSCASGSARQSLRRRVSGRGGMTYEGMAMPRRCRGAGGARSLATVGFGDHGVRPIRIVDGEGVGGAFALHAPDVLRASRVLAQGEDDAV